MNENHDEVCPASGWFLAIKGRMDEVYQLLNKETDELTMRDVHLALWRLAGVQEGVILAVEEEIQRRQ